MKIQKVLQIFLLLLIVILQVRLFSGDGSYLNVKKLEKQILKEQAKIAALEKKNLELAAIIRILKQNPSSIEEQARLELGLIKPGEKYYQVVEPIE